MWLWLCWQSGSFQFKRSAVRIQSSAKFYYKLLTVEKTKIKKKRLAVAQIKKVSFYISRRRKKIKWEKCFISFFGRLRFHLTEIFLSCCCCYWWCHIKMIMIVLSWNKTQNFLFDNFKFLSYNLRSHLPPPPQHPISLSHLLWSRLLFYSRAWILK